MNDWERLHRQAERYKQSYPPGTRVSCLNLCMAFMRSMRVIANSLLPTITIRIFAVSLKNTGSILL